MIIIDPGHGGADPGGGSNQYFKEKDINSLISDYQKRRFDELGIESKRTRTSDVTLNPTERVNRVEALGASVGDILISNHINSGGDSGGEVIYSLKSKKNLPQKIANNLASTGLKIRNVYQRMGRLGNDFYFILRNTAPATSMIIEYGFADNEEDTLRILYEWPTLAEAVVKAITEYLGVPYSVSPTKTYVVKPGDSLYSIAKKFNTTVDLIKQENDLTSNDLYPGNVLYITNA